MSPVSGATCRKRGLNPVCVPDADVNIAFNGRGFPADLISRVGLLEAANLAGTAVQAGTKPGDLRWNHPARDFIWLDSAGLPVKMDAYTLLALATRVARHHENTRLERAIQT